MKVFVTGATGFVGRHILARLKEDGHIISVLVRPGSEKNLPFMEGIGLVTGDIMDPSVWAKSLNNIDAVIHLTGIIREFPANEITFENLHFEATRNIVESAKAANVKRFIHMSANGASPNGVSEYQTTKWRAEKLVTESSMAWTIFRPSVIFGNAGAGMEFTAQIAKIISMAPVMPVFGDGEYMLEPVAVPDVADCFVKALTESSAENKTFHLGCGTPLTYNEIIQIIGKAVGKIRTPTIKIPFGLIEPVVRALGKFKSFPVTVDQLNILKAGNTCPEHDFVGVFNVKPTEFTYKNLPHLALFKKKRRG